MTESPTAAVQAARRQLAARLREIRTEAGLTATELARRLDWYPSKVSRIEHARTPPAIADIRVWCAACGADNAVDDLVASAQSADSMYMEWRQLQKTGLRHLQESRCGGRTIQSNDLLPLVEKLLFKRLEEVEAAAEKDVNEPGRLWRPSSPAGRSGRESWRMNSWTATVPPGRSGTRSTSSTSGWPTPVENSPSTASRPTSPRSARPSSARSGWTIRSPGSSRHLSGCSS
ncbi:helix-turn-helix domain-containing protein [Streptomyces asiaticus]